ncbi:MAG: hypothetical protein HY304_03920 [candidate division Zixibacteria bacterium]|nr:hypothetical protein [candidate division Zixibacteria bacterium]
MATTQSFKGNGSPQITFRLRGPLASLGEHEFTGILDTGFTGFVSIPLLKAFPIGLVLSGMTNLTLADGKSQSHLYCLGEVLWESRSEVGIVVLAPPDATILVGMEFLRKFNLTMIVDPQSELLSLHDTSGE